MRHSGRAAPGLATGPVPPPSARLRTGLAPLLCGIAILLATAATAHAASTVTVPFGGGLRKESATVIECERHGFSADRMNAWLDTATTRMQVTGSASPEEVKALRRLQRIVVG